YKQSAGRGNNLSLQFFPTAEGYVNVNEGIFEYVYNYTDHLGNVRVSYTKGEDGNRKIVDENSYYPFGLKHNNQSIVNTANPNYKYKYNGKELQEELNLNLYDYGARNYDPAIGRWMNIDPLAEKMRRHSPYNYAFNNPVYFIDPDGMQTEDWKQDKLGNYVYDASLTKENASDKLSDDEKYLGESYSVEVRSNESGNSGTLNLNENGTASMTMGNTTLDLENNTFDLGFESGHKVMAGNYNESDMTSTSAFIGYSGSLLNKSEIMIKAGSKGGDLSNMRHISNTLKNTGKLGRGLGVLGIGVSIFEDYRSNNLGWGTGAKVVIRGGLLLVSAPVGLSIAAVDIGWGLATGTTITDNVANYVDKKMSK
ncbi:RHS repeat domain-containing protein, partial [Faecalibacter rhinopitheci]